MRRRERRRRIKKRNLTEGSKKPDNDLNTTLIYNHLNCRYYYLNFINEENNA